MNTRRKTVPLLVLTAIATAACSVPRLAYQDRESTVARPYWSYAAAGKPFLLEVYRPPEGIAPAELAAIFPSPPWVAPVGRFTVDPAEAARPDYRFVLLFDAPQGVEGSDLCTLRQVPGAPGPAAADTDAAHAAFCYENQAITDVRAENVDQVFAEGTDTARARDLLFRIGTALLPPRQIDDDEDELLLPSAGGGISVGVGVGF